MKSCIVLLLATTLALAGSKPERIPIGSKVFIDSPSEPFSTFFDAAFRVKHVPLVLVQSKQEAGYILTVESSSFEATKTIFRSPSSQISEAAFKLTDQSGRTIWSYAATKALGKQSLAEACAKHLKSIVK